MTGLHRDDCPAPDDIAAMLCARLEGDSLHALEQHVAACAACRKLLSVLAQIEAPVTTVGSGEPPGDLGGDRRLASSSSDELGPALGPGQRVGRYVVARLLGTGAMGAVYAAFDPELDRKVALKILGHRGDRLRWEAQAMAQLAHPHVVAVHDVGTVEDRIFIAMELVEGETLAGWLAGAPRSWRAVLSMFVSAGEGLAAAHAAGLVHHDFKPENVLVGQDGRVRVGDFGLASMRADEPAPSSEQLGPEAASLSRSTTAWLAGTPYYMAPEQFLGRATDARSDQFSFCVALYAAIAREHPFDGDGADGLVEAVIAGRARRPPARSILPRWLLRVLRRGLAAHPEDRYPDMNTLLAELRRDPGRRRARGAIVAVAVLGLAAGVALVARSGDARLCTGARPSWAGVWDAPRAQIVERAFAATGKPYATAVYASVARELGAYGERWIAMHTEACEATRVRGEQTEDLLERRMLCLDARLRDAHALVERFAAADADTVERAPVAVGSLGALASCADLQALAGQVRPPADAVTRARVAQLHAELADLKALRVAGRARESRPRIGALVEVAAAVRYRPLEAEALQEEGDVEVAAGDLAVAAGAYEQAVWAAEAGRDDERAAHAWLGVMRVRRAQARYDDALAITPRVTAVLERLGGHEEIEGELHIVRSGILSDASRFDDARAEAENARAILERRFGPGDLRVADALAALAAINGLTSHLDEALAYFRRLRALKQQHLGGDHPAVATSIYNLGATEESKGLHQEALASLASAEAIFVRAVDANHPMLAAIARQRGIVYAALGQLDDAVASYRRAMSIAEAAYGPGHPVYAVSLMDMGDALEGLGRHREALAALRSALALLEKRLGPAHIRIAICLVYIARTQAAQRHLIEARKTITQAIAMYEQLVGRDSPNLREALLEHGSIELALGAPAQALVPLERAHALGPPPDPEANALIQWALGRALVESHRDRARGMALVRAAQDEFHGDARAHEELQQLLAWRRRHR
ncbi:MAG TPA: serine/threonine-protein kinase [Kofleriaceae bacterium]|nr:serine/threonine-protein kinase [Kofleriaceae bacterium]